ncbi:PQQ-dependent sugar dehydrogenase [Sphaerisporangium corydalis]|uniref:PQQ-dependent sugar dehydrogenase n=1 Tax=Sphaerisporangium corydalis TaxID=1441875 RepID=A0ABV9E9W3_9ACTN|nr:PQQ-dependent sugar dehydrogenase [Sphaerisporangium corydalis]
MRARLVPALILALLALVVTAPEARAQVLGGFDFSRAEVSVTGLQVPWGLAFLPDGSALVAERNTGRIMQVRPGQTPTAVATINGVSASGESGLLGIAVSPTFAQDNWLYAYFTSTTGDNRLVRLLLNQPQTQSVLFSGVPSNTFHDGGRIAFGPDGMLYVATGDAGNSANAQNLNSPAGKILRMSPTGAVPSDNPIAGSRVWTYGHRNVQGLTWDPQGRMYAAELGQNTWDEVNQIVAGSNYGWPTCEGTCSNSSFRNPIVTWTTAEASPSGLAWANNTLFVAALRGQRLWAVPLTSTPSLPSAEFVSTYGRLRTVAVGPDGWLWVTTSNRDGRGTPVAQDDRIVRVPPATTSGDTTPPSAPSGLAASGTTATGTTLTWTAATDNVGVAGYDVLRAPGASGGTFTLVGTSATTSFADTGLTASTTYRYQVRARDAANNISSVSNTATVTTTTGGGGTGGCSVAATVQTQWGNGYVVQPVTVTNTGTSAINGWTVTFTLPSGHTVTGSWNATLTVSGQTVTAKSAGHNGALGAGQSTTFGFQASRPNGTTQTPSGYQCTSP